MSPPRSHIALALAIVLVGLAGCTDKPTKIDISNISDETVEVAISVSRDGQVLREYNVTAGPGTTLVDDDFEFKGQLEFSASSSRGTAEETLSINRETRIISLLIANDAFEWGALHADP